MSVALDYRPAILGSAGIARAVRELAIALAARGDVELHLFGHSLAPAARAVAVPASARLHRLPVPGRSLPLLGRCGLGADVLAGHADVFHWTDYVYPPVTSARPVLTVHDLAFARDVAFHGGEAAATLLERTRAAAARAAAIVVPSAASADDVRARLQPRGGVHVVPFGSDHVPTTRLPHPLDDRPFALMLGTIEPRKNHLRLLAAWRSMRRERPLLVVVGRRGWQCSASVQALEAAADEGWLQWRDDADDDEVFALLAHARMLVYPSLWEGFGFPPLEAMALGTPVVAGDCAPLRELCGDAARFCKPTDVDAIADAVDAVLGDTTLRRDLAARGRRRAATFTWRRCAAQHATIYAEVSR